MQENCPESCRAMLQNVRIRPPKPLGPILAGVVFVAPRDRFGRVINVPENGDEDLLDTFDFDSRRQGSDSFDLGQGAQIENGPYIQRFQRGDPGGSDLGGLGGAEEKVGASDGGGWDGSAISAQRAEIVDTFYEDEGRRGERSHQSDEDTRRSRKIKFEKFPINSFLLVVWHKVFMERSSRDLGCLA